MILGLTGMAWDGAFPHPWFPLNSYTNTSGNFHSILFAGFNNKVSYVAMVLVYSCTPRGSKLLTHKNALQGVSKKSIQSEKGLQNGNFIIFRKSLYTPVL